MYYNKIVESLFKIFPLFTVLVVFSCVVDPNDGGGNTQTRECVDIDGNNYRVITIGSQKWMAENLKVTRYRDGAGITKISDNSSWQNASNGAYSSYENNDGNITSYGLLYNKYAVTSGHNLAPKGWHVPSETEWQTLINNLGGNKASVNDLKSPTGFAALAAGFRDYSGGFQGKGNVTGFWSKGNAFKIDFSLSTVAGEFQHATSGFSVRCLKD